MSKPSAKLEVGASEADSTAPREAQRGETSPASGITERHLTYAEHERLIGDLRLAQDQLRADLDAMTRLHRLGSLFVREGNLGPVLGEIVDAAIAISGADFGNIQLLDAESSDLRIVAHRGFPDWWLEFWNSVSKGQGVCGTALERGERVIVEDVERSPIFVGTPALEVQRRVGVRAVQSTPLVSRSGKPLGMFSTHWRKPGRPDARCLRLLDLLARHAADITERAQNEEALLRHRELLQRVFEKIPVLLVMWDPRFRRFTLNRKAEEVLGLSTTEANERDLMSAVYPSAEYRAEAAAFMQSLQPEFREWICRSKSGEDVPIGWANIRLTDETMIGVGVDLRERKRAEAALRVSEERFRLLVQGVKDYAIYMLDPDGTVSSWSAGAEKIFGYRQEEVVGQRRAIFFTEEGRRAGEPQQALEEAAAAGRCEQEGWRVKKDGSRFFADVLITGLRDDAGRLRGFANVTRDVTERRRSQAALRESEERLRLAQQVARAGSFDWDIQSGVNTWTPELEALYGLPPGGFGRTEAAFEQLVHPEDRDQVLRWVDRAMETGAPAEGEWRAVWPDGSVHWIAGRWQVLKDGFCKPIRMTGINFDVTEHKRAEELRASEAALREADRRKNEFLGVLSHELRNPLAPIRSAVAVLENADSASVQAKRARDILSRQVEHLTRLVEDLLEVRRIATGKLRLRTGMVDLVELVRETVEDIRPFFVQRSLNLTFDAPPARIWVNGDRTRLEQVASNLLHNASKFTDRGGNVVVTVEAHGGEAQLRVRDDGVGIAPALMSMLFEAFVQGEKTLDRSRGGLGLGLSLVRGIAELHGGSVAARSEGVGKGSEFIVTLPTTEAPAPITAEPKPARAPLTSKRRVVIVEDNLDAAEALRDLLEVLGGHEVNVAYDGESGVNAIRRYTPDIVLCDLGLPGIDGYEVARRVRADGVSARTRLVALSGYASTDDIERALRAGFDYHLAKPPDAHRILYLVADAGAATAATLPAALVTGHGELDFRHGSILADAALLRSASADTLWESLRSLERHAVADFDYEEEVMENVKYPQLDAHRQEHRDFLTTFGQLQEKLRREGATPENVRALAHAVETWLPAHVEDEDRRFAEFVRGQITRAA